MKITTNKKDLEFKCDELYYTDALKIAKQLKQVVLYPQHKNCIGLAHNQIRGNKAVFIAKISNKWRTFINPCITKKDGIFTHQESCMSFPNKSNKITRYETIELHESQMNLILFSDIVHTLIIKESTLYHLFL